MTPTRRAGAGLLNLGVPVRLVEKPRGDSFLPGCWIEQETLCVCPWAAQAGSVFHEAGHLCTLPRFARRQLKPGVIPLEAWRWFFRGCRKVPAWHPPLIAFLLAKGASPVSILNAPEYAANAWAFAAAAAVSFPTKDVFEYRFSDDLPKSEQPYLGAR